jgi:hypothetical protein
MIDDNFVQPQPGTSAGDHPSAVMPTIALLLFARSTAYAHWFSTTLQPSNCSE